MAVVVVQELQVAKVEPRKKNNRPYIQFHGTDCFIGIFSQWRIKAINNPYHKAGRISFARYMINNKLIAMDEAMATR